MGEGNLLCLVFEVDGVPFNIKPRDKEWSELALVVFCGKVFVVEEVASAVGSGFVNYHGVGLREDALAG